MKFYLGLTFLITIFFLGNLMVREANDARGITKIGIPAEKAWVLFTEERWGCIYNQQTKEAVTKLVKYEDEKFARIEEIKNPEDQSNRYELYLCFLAKGSSGLPGCFILKLDVKHQNPSIKGSLLVDQAKLIKRDMGYFFQLKARVDGLIEANLLYGKQPRLKDSIFLCPEADIFDPYEGNFLKAYEIDSVLRIETEKMEMSKTWDRVDITPNPSFLKEANGVDAGEELLDALDKEFSSSRHFIFLWNKSKISTRSIESIVRKMEEEKNLRYNISIKIRYKEKTDDINRGDKLFVPELRQKISIREPNGQITGGEVWIAVTPLSIGN